jgi:oligosaccharide repeat unit polymerase
MGILVFLWLLLLFLAFVRYKSFLHPLFIFPLLLGLYSDFTLYLVDKLGLINFPRSLLNEAYFYGFSCLIMFLLGYSLYFLIANSKRLSIIVPEVSYEKKAFVVLILLAFVGFLMAFWVMKYVAGTINYFLSHLNERQILFRGKAWAIFFIFPLKVSFFYIWHLHTLSSTRLLKFTLIVLFMVNLIVLSLIGGRLFALMFVIQIYLIYRAIGSISGKTLVGFIALIVVIVVIYGLYRYAQGVYYRFGLNSPLEFIPLALANWQILLKIFLNVFFDGWYVLLNYMWYSRDSHAYGLDFLSSIFKLVPHLTAYFQKEYIPFYRITSDVDLQYRAKSFLAEAYLDFGFLGSFYFSILGFIVATLYSKYESMRVISVEIRRKLFLWLYFFSVFYVNSLLLIRNGAKGFFTWFFTELFWLFFVWLVLTICSMNRLIFRKMKVRLRG